MTPAQLSEQLFLDHLVATSAPVKIYLRGGIKLTGVIVAHSGGGDVLWIQSHSNPDELSMLFLWAISTICPLRSNILRTKSADELDSLLQ